MVPLPTKAWPLLLALVVLLSLSQSIPLVAANDSRDLPASANTLNEALVESFKPPGTFPRDVLPRGNDGGSSKAGESSKPDDSTEKGWLNSWDTADYGNIYKLKSKLTTDGRKMACMLDAREDSSLAPQSPYNDVADLERYGWTFQLHSVHAKVKAEDLERLEQVLDELRISSKLSDWHKIIQVHNGKSAWAPTRGNYENLVNFKDGIIVAASSYGPVWQNEHRTEDIAGNRRKMSENRIVPLRHWSDVLFLGLQQAAKQLNVPPKRLGEIQHVFRLVEEDVAVKRACVLISMDTTDPFQWPKFPGKTYDVAGGKSIKPSQPSARLMAKESLGSLVHTRSSLVLEPLIV